MPIKPKRGYARPHIASKEVPAKYCENPQCGAKLSREQVREGNKYCSRDCRWEHDRALALERRPKDVRCAFCKKEIDVMREKPSYWAEHKINFCDEICTDGYRRQHGFYAEMSKKGNAVTKQYKEKHKQVINHEDRSKAVSKNNKERPPKAKYFLREGRAWGYDVRFYPDENESGYRISVPELPELGVMYSKTVKDGLKLVREKILETRITEGENNAIN